MQLPAVLGDLSDELRMDVDLAPGLFERFALAGDGVAWVFGLDAAAGEFVVVSCDLSVRSCRS